MTIVTAAAVAETTGGNPYEMLHAPRLAQVLNTVLPWQPRRVLDVSRAHLTTLLHQHLKAPVDSLGFGMDGPTPEGFHYEFDLNSCQFEDRWRTDLPTYPLVTMCEVIEHVHTSPLLVLRYLRTLVEPGGRLVIQTPNAVALHKRLKMIAGRN